MESGFLFLETNNYALYLVPLIENPKSTYNINAYA
ncbi:hypothetical protein BC751_3068 [Cecembia calidifontis]|jgi:hypothetical protein|uniref:Uncharacterized protein n=1 Tax=Cecembia calidifontis TaxID=1187080 RepID=A0A4Q7PB48_9BACT|nr:hypothetical protein BC751_3068 [Cecembia calidifontis]